MTTRNKLIIGGLVLVEAVLIIAMIAVVRPTNFSLQLWPGGIGLGGIGAREVIVEETVAVSPAPEIRIVNDVGNVKLSTGDAGVVTVKGERLARQGADPQAQDRPTVKKVDNRVEIEYRALSGTRPPDQVDLVVQVPEESRVTVEAKTGRVNADELTGSLTVDAAVGCGTGYDR